MNKLRGKKEVLLLILISLTICMIDVSRSSFKRPYSSELKSARLIGLRLSDPVNGTRRSLDFDLKSSEQRRILSDILSEISEGKIIKVTDSDMEFFHPGGSGPMLQLCFKDGTRIDLKSSVTFTQEVEGQGIITRSRMIEGQITVFTNYLSEPIRIIAPETKRLIDEDLGTIINLIKLQ